MMGKLILIPTPIGNLEDITLRALKVLEEVDVIAAEDTRHSLKLLNHFGIKKPMISYHQHNRHSAGEKIIEMILQGKSIGLITDAGMPGISDPGSEILSLCLDEGICVEALPGPSAFLLGLVLSGFDTGEFHFIGFLERKKKMRDAQLLRIKEYPFTTVLYEAPHRIIKLLEELHDHLGDREVVLARELTKKFEEIIRGPLPTVMAAFESKPPKGEFVVVISGAVEEVPEASQMVIKETLEAVMAEGFSKKEAIERVATRYKLPKKEVYKEALKIK